MRYLSMPPRRGSTQLYDPKTNNWFKSPAEKSSSSLNLFCTIYSIEIEGPSQLNEFELNKVDENP